MILGTIVYRWKVQKFTWPIVGCTCLCGRRKIIEWTCWEKRGKLFLGSTILNGEIGSDGSVSMHDITTTALQAENVEQDDDLDDL